MIMASNVDAPILNEVFVDRLEYRQRFEDLLGVEGQPPVVNIHGLGGYGKSALLEEFKALSEARSHPVAILDLKSYATMDAALTYLVKRLRSGGVRLGRFELAYAVYWHWQNQDSPLTRDTPLLQQLGAEVIPGLLPVGGGIFATASNLCALLGPRIRERHQLGADDDLRHLDDLKPSDLTQAVLRFFARDLNDNTARSVLLVDHYEVLGDTRGTESASWIRQLAAYLKNTLVVVGSIEPLSWRPASDWTGRIEASELSAFDSERDCRLLLNKLGVNTASQPDLITESRGIPLWLKLSAQAHNAGAILDPSDDLYTRFVEHLDEPTRSLLDQLALMRRFDEKCFEHIATHFGSGHTWQALAEIALYERSGDGCFSLHGAVTETIHHRLLDTHNWHRAHLELAKRRKELGHPESSILLHRYAAEDIGHAELHEALESQTGSTVTRLEFALDLRHAVPPRRPNDVKPGRLETTAKLLAAKASIEIDEVEVVLEDLSDTFLETLEDEERLRMRVVRGHAERISGETAAALESYRVAFSAPDPSTRFEAHLWAADVAMAAGDFVSALETLPAAEDAPGTTRVTRVRHLIHRHALDFDRARSDLASSFEMLSRLEEGKPEHQVLDLELRVNALELEAWANSSGAGNFEGLLCDLQQARYRSELGKALTATAYLKLAEGKTDEAGEQVETAMAVLTDAQYRSGLARAQLAAAMVAARNGNGDTCIDLITKSVRTLEEVGVYPVSIVMAYRVAERIGQPLPMLRCAASAALTRISFPSESSRECFETRVSELLRVWLDDGLADRREKLSTQQGVRREVGNYNENLIGYRQLFRSAIPAGDDMDFRLWPNEEHVVLWAAAESKLPVPRLFSRIAAPRPFQVHEVIRGRTLEQSFPGETGLPVEMPTFLGNFLADLGEVPLCRLPRLPSNWPDSGDTDAFAGLLENKTRHIFGEYRGEFHRLWANLEFPLDPLDCLSPTGLGSRQFHLLHSDLHRRNVIIRPDHVQDLSSSVVIDWELALWGDPVYDLAVHLHKMRYTPAEEAAAIAARLVGVPEGEHDSWMRDAVTYRKQETIKSALVDSVRYTKRYADLARAGVESESDCDDLAKRLTTKINAARSVWRLSGTVEQERVEAAMRSYSE